MNRGEIKGGIVRIAARKNFAWLVARWRSLLPYTRIVVAARQIQGTLEGKGCEGRLALYVYDCLTSAIYSSRITRGIFLLKVHQTDLLGRRTR